MADIREPIIIEDYTTLTGTATWAFDNDTGFSHNNTQMVGGTITLINAALSGTAIFPLFIPHTFVNWLTSVETITGTADVEVNSVYQPTYQDLLPAMTNLSDRSDELQLRVNLAAGANSLDNLIITYNMSFATETDIDEFSYIDTESTAKPNFTTTQKRSAIRYAHAKLMYIMKNWNQFYSNKFDIQVRKLIKEAETYYALSILYDRKAKMRLNDDTDNNRFSVGDMNVDPADSETKGFYVNFQAISTLYKAKADEIIGMISPPGTDTIRTTFYFDMCKSIKEKEDDDLSNV